MKIIKVIGGLGNQMFQYSFYLFLKSKGEEVKLDISEFERYDHHNGFELNNIFNVLKHVNLATSSEINTYKDRFPVLKIRKIVGKVFANNPNIFIKRTHWIEPKYSHFYKDIEKKNQIYLEGYWQNENYLIHQDQTISKIFQWKLVDGKNLALGQKMAQEESVAIHVRRLDTPHNFKQFLFTLRLRFVWRLASKKYYNSSIEYINSKVIQPQYYIFADNISWVKKHIPLTKNITIIDWNRGNNSNQDMYLMTKCKHNIISMSSFSWWGAWLNNNPNKIVIAPTKWAPRFSTKDEIIPEEWIRL